MYMINKRGQEDVIYWRCHRSRNCHCTGPITTGPGDAIVSVKDTHNHPPDQASIEVKKLVSTIQDCIRPIPQLYQEALVFMSDLHMSTSTHEHARGTRAIARTHAAWAHACISN